MAEQEIVKIVLTWTVFTDGTNAFVDKDNKVWGQGVTEVEALIDAMTAIANYDDGEGKAVDIVIE